MKEETSHDDEGNSEYVVVSADLPISGRRFQADMHVPAGRTRPTRLLPIFHSLADALMQSSVNASVATGKTVSCQKRCAACCRQLVPVTEVEAYNLRKLIDAMPHERQTEIRARFEAGIVRLSEAGVFERLRRLNQTWGDDLVALIIDYFRLWIDCPFLEDEACSVYAERPASCREHIVTSPAERCLDPLQAGVERVPIPAEAVSDALKCFNADESLREKGWMPLILSLEWTDACRESEETGDGPELLALFFRRMLMQNEQSPTAH